MIESKQIEDVLRGVIHPAFDRNVVELELVEAIRTEEEGDMRKIKFKLVFPRPDALSASIKASCKKAVEEAFPGYAVEIMELVREKKAHKAKKLETDQMQLENVDKIIAIASGKGGVGKSTVAVNLAVTLAKMGYRVGLADADVYGPSIPKMTGTEGEVPQVYLPEGYREGDNSELIVPIEKYGVKWMSIGYFAAPEQALSAVTRMMSFITEKEVDPSFGGTAANDYAPLSDSLDDFRSAVNYDDEKTVMPILFILQTLDNTPGYPRAKQYVPAEFMSYMRRRGLD